MGQEEVAELDLPARRQNVARALGVATVEGDDPDHRAVELDHEEAGTSTGNVGELALELGPRSRAAEVGAHLGRGGQVDETGAVRGL